MASIWNRDFLTRRIDRCYLIAAGARVPEKRKAHLELARHYRRLLGSVCDHPSSNAGGWQEFAAGQAHDNRITT